MLSHIVIQKLTSEIIASPVPTSWTFEVFLLVDPLAECLDLAESLLGILVQFVSSHFQAELTQSTHIILVRCHLHLSDLKLLI